ncbi:hypothetical protein IW262DRAFT_1469787 [Armillaria fumosa]|nr:hypothetical protein IW262DRAFT_1469787 [Armillaria fumosa]
MTAHIWDNEIPEVKADIATCVDKERELIRVFKNGTLKSSDLTDDGKVMVIDSLYQQFGNMVKNLVEHLKYNYGCTIADGKDFISSFNNATEAKYIPGMNEGESRAFNQYYGLPFMLHMKKVHLSHNRPPPTAEQKAYVASPADIDPVTLVTDDALDLIQASVKANAPDPLPPAYLSVPSNVTPLMFVPLYSISSHPLLVTAFLSETLMDTGSNNPDTSLWAHSYSGDSVITSSTSSGIDNNLA